MRGKHALAGSTVIKYINAMQPAGTDTIKLKRQLSRGLRVPAIAAPMFLISGPDLVLAACRAGVIGAFPAPNCRSIEQLDQWLSRIVEQRQEGDAPWAFNIIAHRSYERLEPELEMIEKHQPPLVITALGSPRAVVDVVHGYGGAVIADVNSLKFARKAAAMGVDGLALVCAGAGGHTGQLTPLAFVPEVRRFFDGLVIVGGGITSGGALLALEALGADYGYVGTAFIAARESLASDGYRQMLVDCDADDLCISSAVTGVPASWMRPSLEQAGIDAGSRRESPNFVNIDGDIKRWRDIWSAGQGVGGILAEEPAAAIVERLETEYLAARERILKT